jgi:hypothetical protein
MTGAREKLLVMVESPLAGNVTRNVAYARACLLDSLRRGECPFAMHLLYPQVLDDTKPGERELGISSGLAWSSCADLVAVYTDLGVSKGMQRAIDAAGVRGLAVEMRSGIWDLAKVCTVCFGVKTIMSGGVGRCHFCPQEVA